MLRTSRIGGGDMNSNFMPGHLSPGRPQREFSAPSSPARTQGSMYSQVQGLTRGIFQAAAGTRSATPANARVLLVIDDPTTDWSKYFRAARVGEWDVVVEQGEFPELRIVADSTAGAAVTITSSRTGNPVVKTFRPDFVLIRQPVKTATADYRRIVTGLLFGGVPALNSLHSIYNFIDKPWVFAHLLMIQKRLGKEKFPLIEQVYYPTTQDLEICAKLPAVLKLGHGHKGLGKMRVGTEGELGDLASVVAAADQHCTLEPFVDAKYDIHIQKIGTHYKAFMRKGISGHWKANLGSSMLEQIAMTERYRLWADEVAGLFGGLEVCGVSGLVGRDGSEVVYEANGSSFPLLGETQEEDRRLIAELALAKMTKVLLDRAATANGTSSRRVSGGDTGIGNFIKHDAPSYSNTSSPAPHRPTVTTNGNGAPPPQSTNPFLPASGGPPATVGGPPPMPPRNPPPRPQRTPSLPREPPPPPPPPTGAPPNGTHDGRPGGEADTMGQLRKTFAGIFGDM